MQHIVVGTAGHIDHGKSTLVRALTGIDPDRLKEEKARGITIELGFAHARVGDTRVAFVDVPGHERFVRTMLAGVGGIDCVMLIVAADESVMPQTREHFDICRLLHVPQGLVVITKADLADADTLALVEEDVRELVAGSFLEGAPVIPVSAATGAGLDALRGALAASAARVAGRPLDGAARLPIDRVFSMKGFGTVVTGTLVSGRIAQDEELDVMPGGRRAKVRGIQVHGASTRMAEAGQRAAVNLGGVEVADIARGETLAAAGTLAVTRRVDALVELLPGTKPLRHGARVRLHHGTAEVLGRVSVAGPAASEIEPGGHALARIRLEGAAVLTRHDRFILRAYSPPVTIGGGLVLDPAPTRAAIRTSGALAALQRLEPRGHDDLDALGAMVESSGLAGLPISDLIARGGVAPAAMAATTTRLEAAGIARAGERLVSRARLDAASAALVALVGAFHRDQPLSDGMPREEARERVFAGADPAVFELVLQRLKAAHTLGGADRLSLASHRAAGSGDDARVKAAVVEAYRKGGLKPPDAATLAAAAGAPAAIVEKITTLLVREKTLVRVDTLVFHAEALQRLKAEMAALKAVGGGTATVDVAAFKDRYGVSRKFAIPLLEYLDRERVTRRSGDVRLVL